MSYINAHQRASIAEESFNNQRLGDSYCRYHFASLPSQSSVFKMAMVAGLEVIPRLQ